MLLYLIKEIVKIRFINGFTNEIHLVNSVCFDVLEGGAGIAKLNGSQSRIGSFARALSAKRFGKEKKMTNQERRDAGLAYIADESVFEEMMICRRLLQKLNFMDRSDIDGIKEVVAELFGSSDGAFVNPPFYCDYGKHIEVGKNFFANYNCTLLDVAKIRIGDNCQMAPNVAVYTAGHPVYPSSRNSAYEYGKEVTIGDNVWIGGSVVVCPGVHIGSNVVIGAGSVVTKDIPDWCIAAGNPCKVIRAITKADQRKLFHGEEIDEEAWADIVERMGSVKTG